MARVNLFPSVIEGEFFIPPSKSQTLRAIFFAALSHGNSTIRKALLDSPDTEAMIQAVKQIGAKVEKKGLDLQIRGIEGTFQCVKNVVDCGNSGIVLRFMGALAGLIPHYTILTGDDSIRRRRVAASLLDGLQQLGAFAVSTKSNGYAPLIIKGPFTKGYACIDGLDSQPVSGLLIAASLSSQPTHLQIQNPQEKPWVDLTLYWLDKLGVTYKREGYDSYILPGKASWAGFDYQVPGDFSSAAFPAAAALLSRKRVVLHNLNFQDPQGDKLFFALLEKMGARFSYQGSTFVIEKINNLQGICVDLDDCIDALPILSVLACFASSQTEIQGAQMARHKESDRISVMVHELRKMGAHIEETKDGMIIHPASLRGASLNAHYDHRVAMSLAVASWAAAQGPSILEGKEWVAKTYPTFWGDFQKMGAVVEEL